MSAVYKNQQQFKPRPARTAPTPSMATQQYSLRHRPHDRQMLDHTGHLADKNFLIHMLFKDSY